MMETVSIFSPTQRIDVEKLNNNNPISTKLQSLIIPSEIPLTPLDLNEMACPLMKKDRGCLLYD